MKLRKVCASCKQLKPTHEFHVNRASSDSYHYYCKSCQNEKNGKYRATNPEKVKQSRLASYKRNYVRRTYGLTPADFDALMAAQGGCCPICRKKLKRPSVDHCHGTGRIRGILCRHCNSSLSVFENDPSAIVRLAAYLGLPTVATDVR